MRVENFIDANPLGTAASTTTNSGIWPSLVSTFVVSAINFLERAKSLKDNGRVASVGAGLASASSASFVSLGAGCLGGFSVAGYRPER